MFLKSLTLVGFKSFADRTRLEFGPGTNVVVGPNGSGKSNLVDAVAWVMGTQATSALRLQKMDELIFSGTAVRNPHGRAEVSLTFDNTSGGLPLDLAEVTLTRRLYRDGTSEYEINGASCRLQDIGDLLSDSGVGRHQHVVIGQGRITEVLNACPEDQRLVIEESAGVTKHRSRRDRALRRLEATEADTRRLNDILAEQQRRMRPLRRQAKAAERHRAMRAEVRSLQLWIGGEELRSVSARRSDVSSGLIAADGRIAETASATEALETDIARLDGEARVIAAALDGDTFAAARLEATVQRLKRIAAVARERRRSAERARLGEQARREATVTEMGKISTQLQAAEGEAAAMRITAEKLSQLTAELESEDKALAGQLKLPVEGVEASLRGELVALEAAATRDEAERVELEARSRVVEEMIRSHVEEAGRVNDEVRAVDSVAASLATTHNEAEAARQAAATDEAETRRRLEEARTRLAAAEARLEVLAADAEAAATAAALDRDPDIHGPVLDGLGVPSRLRDAVSAALGIWSQARVTSGPHGVAAAARRLKQAGHGGVALVTNIGDHSVPARRAEQWGGSALCDLVEGDAALASLLLGDVAMFEGWSTALRFVERHPQLRAVTPDGDLITAYGIRLAGLESPSAMLEDAEEAAAAALTETRRAESRHHAALRAAAETARVAAAAAERLESTEARLGGLAEALATAERRRSDAESELARLHDRLAVIGEATSIRSQRMRQLQERLDSAADSEYGARHGLSERRDEVASQLRRTAGERDAARARLAALEERIRIYRLRISELQTDPARYGGPADGVDAARLREVEDIARRGLSIVRTHLATLRQSQLEHREASDTIRAAVAAAHRRRSEIQTEMIELRERRAALEVEAAELRVRKEAICESLRRTADSTEEQALAAPRPVIDDDPAARLDELERRLHRMGPVNPMAADEYAEIAEKVEFLSGQMADLEASRSELRKVIAALERNITAEFKAAFDDIAHCFRENFSLLFPGGRGELLLTEPESPLTTGVEIKAQPLGKRVSRLSLLSGGERALAALAFLFAVFRARPSPFYLLDEVEAALDDANLHRFIGLVETMRGTAQLLIVTHQQQTMEAADVLYGVTMQPGESSVVVSKKLAAVPG